MVTSAGTRVTKLSELDVPPRHFKTEEGNM